MIAAALLFMGTIVSLRERLKNFNAEAIAEKAMEESKGDILKYNQEQLLAGKTRDGTDITPSYLNDPYFKTREAAQRYSDWKDRITPNSKRKSGTPNLYIDGTYHRSIRVTQSGEVLNFDSTFNGANDIERKFGEKIYSLGGEFKAEFIRESLQPNFSKEVENALGLKLK